MEPVILHCHPGTVQFLLPPSRGSCPRLSFYNNEIVRPVLVLAKGGNFTHLYPPFLSVTASHKRTHGQFLWQVFTATMGGKASIEETISETVLEEEISEQIQVLNGGRDKSKSWTAEAVKGLHSNLNGPRHSRRFSVSVDALTPGATFNGKITNIQKYGAFVDIGAFTSGLIHISQMTGSFVKNVEDVVQVGQKVRVQILFVDVQAKRISLKLKNEDREQEVVQEIWTQKMSENGSSEPRDMDRGRQERLVPAIKPQKGEILNGVIKNIIKSGVFVTLPHGYEGFLPASDVNSNTGAVVPESYFKLGQHISVRVLRTERNRIRLTTKKEKHLKKLVADYNKHEGSVRATNPFEIAFRQNKIIATYLEEKKMLQDAAERKISDDSPVALPLSEDL